MALEGSFLPEFWYHLGGGLGKDQSTHHVLAAGPVAAFDDDDAGAASCQSIRRRQTGGATADDDGVEASRGWRVCGCFHEVVTLSLSPFSVAVAVSPVPAVAASEPVVFSLLAAASLPPFAAAPPPFAAAA